MDPEESTETTETPAPSTAPAPPPADPAGKPKVSVTRRAAPTADKRASLDERMARAAKRAGVELPKDDAHEETHGDSEQPKPKPKADTDSPLPDTPEGKLEAAATALEAGDLKQVAKLLGKDAKLVDTSGEKFSVLRRKAEKLEKQGSHLKAEESRIRALGATMREEFGEPKAAKDAYRAGKFSQAAVAIQRWFGQDFATITKNIAREVAGLSPEEKKLLEEKAALEKEKAEYAAEREKSKAKETDAQKREKAIATVTAKCTGHSVLKLKNGAQLVLDEMMRSFDADQNGFRLSFKQAADAVMAQKLEDAKALGFTSVAAAEASKGAPPTPPARKQDPPPTPTSSDRFKKKKSFEERMEAARRLTAKGKSRGA